jgi:hypothetical protein
VRELPISVFLALFAVFAGGVICGAFATALGFIPWIVYHWLESDE